MLTPVTTKDKLIRAALTVTARDGLAAATTAALATEAGVAEGALYRHYKGKDDLLIDAYRTMKAHIFDTVIEKLDSEAPIRDRVLTAWLTIFDAYRADPESFIFANRFAESSLAEREGGKATAAMTDLIAQVRAKAVAEGLVRDLHPDLMRAFFYAPLMSMLKSDAKGRRWTDEELDAAAEAVWASWRA